MDVMDLLRKLIGGSQPDPEPESSDPLATVGERRIEEVDSEPRKRGTRKRSREADDTDDTNDKESAEERAVKRIFGRRATVSEDETHTIIDTPGQVVVRRKLLKRRDNDEQRKPDPRDPQHWDSPDHWHPLS